jgi:hypothetical protein
MAATKRSVGCSTRCRSPSKPRKHGDDVQIVFAGAGTRWLGELTKLGHPARPLFESVREFVKGASCGCAEVFGATKAVEACGVPLLKDHELAGTTGVASLRAAIAEGWTPVAVLIVRPRRVRGGLVREPPRALPPSSPRSSIGVIPWPCAIASSCSRPPFAISRRRRTARRRSSATTRRPTRSARSRPSSSRHAIRSTSRASAKPAGPTSSIAADRRASCAWSTRTRSRSPTCAETAS